VSVTRTALEAARLPLIQLPEPVVRLFAEHVDELIRRLERQLRRGKLDEKRVRAILENLHRSLQELAQVAGDQVLQANLQAADLAVQQALATLGPAFQSLGQVPNLERWRMAAQSAAAVASREVGDLFQRLNRVTAREAERVLLTGVTAGLSPLVVGRELSRVLDVALWRGTTIARTEVLRAYRAATVAAYQQESWLVRGWRWHARLDGHTCAVCVLLHGQTFDLAQPMETHPNCRCAVIPVLAPPFDRLLPEVELGRDWLLRQPRERRVALLGPSRVAALENGAASLDDLIDWRTHPVWGATPVLRPLRELGLVGR